MKNYAEYFFFRGGGGGGGGSTLNCHQADVKSLILTPSFITFSQISTSVPPTPIAVTSMRSVAILRDRTFVRVKQDSQAMGEHALVSRLDRFLKVI